MSNETPKQNRQLTQQWLRLLDGSLSMGAMVELPVLSDSMLPVFGIGRNIKIQRVPWKSCSTGDIIVFREERKLTAHRSLFAVRAGGKCYIFQKGDCNPGGHFIRSERVVGRVVEYQDESGHYRSLSSRVVQSTSRVVIFIYIFRAFWGQARRLLWRKIVRK